jgi:hypothetical protein
MARYTHPNLIERFKNRISLAIAKNPQISSYRLRGASLLNDAYGNGHGVPGAVGGPDLITDVLAGEFFRSPTLARNRVGVVEESFREQTRILLDIMDYQGPGNILPVDSDTLYLRLQDYDVALGGLTPLGPIFIIPPPGFFSMPYPTLTFAGDAPGVIATNGNPPPPDSMRIFLPNFAGSAEIHNLHPTNSLMVAFGDGQPMVQITGASFVTAPGNFNEIIIASPLNNSAVPFAVTAQITNYG